MLVAIGTSASVMTDDPERQHPAAEGREIVKPVIDLHELQRARRDRRIKSFLSEAKEYGHKLDRERRIHRSQSS